MTGWQQMSADELKVLSTTAMKTVFDELSPQFHSATGTRIEAVFGPSGRIEQRLADGEPADMAVLTRAAAQQMVTRGKVLDGSLVDLARSSLGVVVRRGAPKPDISSVAAFKHALLAADAVAVSKPVGGGLSGAHMAKVFEQLGIAQEMAAKARHGAGGPGGLVGLMIERGEAEIGVQQIAELLAVPGVDFVGPLPPELQIVTVFTGVIPTSTRDAALSRTLLDFLTTPAAKNIIKQKGLEPA